MSWIPGGPLRDPVSHSSPRPQAATPALTFGKLEDRQNGADSPKSPVAGPQGACYDEPVEKLRWWKDTGRGQATVTAMRNSDIECFWREAQQDIKTKVGELVNASARKANKQVALGSSVKKSLEDVEPPSFGAHSSLYKEEHCSKHERVGRRGVTYSPEAMQAFLDSKDQALRNKTLGRGTNLTLAQF